MRKIKIYTRSGKVSPSSNYRLLQYADDFCGDVVCKALSPEFLYKKHANAKTRIDKLIWYSVYYFVIQINIFRFMLANLFNMPDCIIVSRAVSPKFIFFINKILLEVVFKKVDKLIWDFDDEIFASKEITKFESDLLKKNSTNIVVTSEYLKGKLNAEAQRKVILMSTTDGEFAREDVNRLVELRKRTYDSNIELLWLATAPSLVHLHKIEQELDKAAKVLEEQTGKKLILNVVCNKPLQFKAESLIVNNVIWSKEKAREYIFRSHIGIMPLVNTITSKGKGGFKIVQYMSAGMPAIASAIGFNNEVIVDGVTGILVDDINVTEKWTNAILDLSSDEKKYSAYSYDARREWERRFSYINNLKEWNRIIM